MEKAHGSGWTVHKFGGTSLGDADRQRAACETVLSQPSNERVAVVVSAMSGVTNALIEAIDRAATRDDSYLSKLKPSRSSTWTQLPHSSLEPHGVPHSAIS